MALGLFRHTSGSISTSRSRWRCSTVLMTGTITFLKGFLYFLLTYLPFGIMALWSSTSITSSGLSATIVNTRFHLSFVILVMVATLSVISHKEVRFIYPLLPAFHVLAAPHVLSFFTETQLMSTHTTIKAHLDTKSWRLYLLIVLVSINICIGLYSTLVHQRGVIDVIDFLRHEYRKGYLSQRGSMTSNLVPGDMFDASYSEANNETFVAFLMPCHSTPWRSHLVYATLNAWALTCEPPLHIPANTPERAAYRDEADRFYDDQQGFLKREVNTIQRPWPRYIVWICGRRASFKEVSH